MFGDLVGRIVVESLEPSISILHVGSSVGSGWFICALVGFFFDDLIVGGYIVVSIGDIGLIFRDGRRLEFFVGGVGRGGDLLMGSFVLFKDLISTVLHNSLSRHSEDSVDSGI